MPRAIRIHQTGGPEVLRLEDVEVGSPGPGQVRVRQAAAGVNFIDTYHRSGLYPLPLPSGLGVDGAGTVEALGPGVSAFSVGQRVAYQGGPPGGYSEVRLVPAERLVPLPAGISDTMAAGMMLKGLTAWYLLRKTYRVQAGDAVLYHAAAGGVGLLACQWLRLLGAKVIGTVSSDAKAEVARAHGCEHVIVYTREDFPRRVRELTGGAGVAVVYDGVGKDTWAGSLDSLRPRGLMVSFGNASGPTGPIDPLVLSQKGSLYLTRPTIAHYTARPEELQEGARELFGLVESGQLKVEVSTTYPLADAARAHRDLEGRRTTGSLVLVP